MASASGSRRRKSGWLPARNQRQRVAGAGRAFFRVPSQSRLCAMRSASAALPDAARTVEQQRVRQPAAAREQRIEDRLVPGVHQRSDRLLLERLADVAERRRWHRSRARAPARPWRARGRRRARARRRRGPRARSGRASCPSAARRLARDLVRAIEHQRAVGHQPGVRRRRPGASIELAPARPCRRPGRRRWHRRSGRRSPSSRPRAPGG